MCPEALSQVKHTHLVCQTRAREELGILVTLAGEGPQIAVESEVLQQLEDMDVQSSGSNSEDDTVRRVTKTKREIQLEEAFRISTVDLHDRFWRQQERTTQHMKRRRRQPKRDRSLKEVVGPAMQEGTGWGVGMELAIDEDGNMIVSDLSDVGSAILAGIRRGDHLVEVETRCSADSTHTIRWKGRRQGSWI